MITFSNKKNQLVAAIVMFLVLVGLVSYGYNTSSANVLARGLKRILPAALVSGSALSIYDIEENLRILKRLEPNVSGEFAYDSLIERTKAKILASDLRLAWEDKIKYEETFYIKSQPIEYDKLVAHAFSGDINLFIKYVVEPSAVDAALRIYFNSDYRINKQAYDRASGLLTDVLAGADFADTAKQHSDDKVSGQFGGDLGFFSDSELLPELQDQIGKGPMGEVQRGVFISRLGYHIVWPLETAEKDGQKLWHAKHILIQTEGFEAWLDQNTADIKVWKIQ
ncbi:MAG: peptidylprolyl isomerase [Candidatus Doudnabacteria bacterium]|nr:peptidylprolyl isomerase [Candidatus Doudnabacteria bacterium]